MAGRLASGIVAATAIPIMAVVWLVVVCAEAMINVLRALRTS